MTSFPKSLDRADYTTIEILLVWNLLRSIGHAERMGNNPFPNSLLQSDLAEGYRTSEGQLKRYRDVLISWYRASESTRLGKNCPKIYWHGGGWSIITRPLLSHATWQRSFVRNTPAEELICDTYGHISRIVRINHLRAHQRAAITGNSVNILSATVTPMSADVANTIIWCNMVTWSHEPTRRRSSTVLFSRLDLMMR